MEEEQCHFPRFSCPSVLSPLLLGTPSRLDGIDELQGKIPMTVVERVPAPKPFEVCYRGGFPRLKRPSSYDVPSIMLELGAGTTANWTLFSDNYLVEVGGGAMCLAILPVKGGEAAVVMGVRQLENNLLEFDREKGVLGFSMLLDFQLSGCRSANLLRNY